MPKTVSGLWEKVVSFESLYRAYLAARKGKRCSTDVLRYGDSLEENIINTQNLLVHHMWFPGRWREFWVCEPKKRRICAPPFEDRVVHHALVAAIEPCFERRFIYDSYACRTGKGTHAAHRRLMRFIRAARQKWGKFYVLQTDISAYFPSIRHDLLIDAIGRSISDPDVMWLIQCIVKDSGFTGRGLPIGALTSQLFANVFLDKLDHHIKDDLGERYYVRYMDDTVTISPSRKHLQEMEAHIGEFLGRELDLRLNPKTKVYPSVRGIDFCGYRCWATHVLPRQRNVRRIQRRLRKMAKLYSRGEIELSQVQPVVASYLGYMQHCNGYKTVSRFLGDLVFERRY